MICADVEQWLSAHLDGEVDPAVAPGIAAHLSACGQCGDALDGLRRTRGLLRSLPVRLLPPELLLQLHHAVGPPPPQRALRVRTMVAAGAAACLGLVGGAAFALGGTQPQTGRVADVEMDAMVAQHVARTVGRPVVVPVTMGPRGVLAAR